MMFSGCFVALVTPFSNGKVDKEGLKSLVEFHIKEGIDGIVPCGTTGESATLSMDEHKEVVELVIEYVGGRIPVIAGAGSNNTLEALELTRFAKKAGASAVLSITPYYNKPTPSGLYEHYRTISSEVDIPIILYNIPSRTGINMSPETIKKISEIENVVGVKEASGDLKQVSEIIRLCGEDFTVLSGDDFIILPLMAVGGKGVISATANVAPRDMTNMIKEFNKGNISEARRLHYKLLPLCKAMFIETNPGPVKAALSMMGKISEEIRLPLVKVREDTREKIKKALIEYGLI
ncbi:MAG: 4-hydroxy-tetrahydrodipicolinate synthase [bacterium]|nr:4-hydroxy-tetrahydrodipicolinate synthase [bacterium]